MIVESVGVDLIVVLGFLDGMDYDVYVVIVDVSLDIVLNICCSFELVLFLGYCFFFFGIMIYLW